MAGYGETLSEDTLDPAGEAEEFSPEGRDPEGEDDEDLEGEEVEVEEFFFDEFAPNLVSEFKAHPEGKKALRSLVSEAYDNYKAAWESCEEYREQVARNMKFFRCDIPPRDAPFEDSCNVNVPITLENVSRVDLRALQEIFGDWTQVYRFVPNAMTENEKEQAEVLTIHGNWQISEGIPNFRHEMDRASLLFWMNGDVQMQSFYDDEKRTNAHETVTPDEFFCPYMQVAVAPDMSDVPYYGRILRWYKHQLEAKRGIWENVDKVLEEDPPGWHEEPESPDREATAESQGIEPASADNTAPYVLVSYEGWMMLPNQDSQRFVQIIFEERHRTPLCMKILEEEDWRDRMRFDQQEKELQIYMQQKEQYEQEIDAFSQHQANILTTADGLDPADQEEIATATLSAQPPAAPLAPQWILEKIPVLEAGGALEPDPVRMVPEYLWSRGTLIHNPNGVFGLGFGTIQADFNRTANMLFSQFGDSAAMANSPGLITSNLVNFDNGFKLAPGSINKTPLAGGKLQEHIMPYQPGPANSQMVDLINRVQQMAQSGIQSPDVLSGAEGPSGETYRGQATRLEQAQNQLSVLARRFSWFLQNVLQVNAKLNSEYLPDLEVLSLMDHKAGEMKEIRIGADLYRKGYKVSVASDLRFVPKAVRVQEATELLQIAEATPELASNPMFKYEALKRYFQARDMAYMIPFMGPPPMPTGMPFGMPPMQPPQPGPGGPPPNEQETVDQPA